LSIYYCSTSQGVSHVIPCQFPIVTQAQTCHLSIYYCCTRSGVSLVSFLLFYKPRHINLWLLYKTRHVTCHPLSISYCCSNPAYHLSVSYCCTSPGVSLVNFILLYAHRCDLIRKGNMSRLMFSEHIYSECRLLQPISN